MRAPKGVVHKSKKVASHGAKKVKGPPLLTSAEFLIWKQHSKQIKQIQCLLVTAAGLEVTKMTKKLTKKNLRNNEPTDEFAISELLKKLEASNSQKPKAQMFLKHLNPLNNIRAAQGVEIVTNFIKNFGCELTTKSYSFLRFSIGEGTRVRSNQNKKKSATDRYAAQIMPIAEKYLRVLTWRGILIGNRTMNYN
jgi:hypothetical protein